MNKKIKIIGGVMAVLAAVIVVPDIGSYYQQLKMLGERLPEKYKAVPFFDDLKSNSHYDIQHFESNVPQYAFMTDTGSLVISTNHLSEESSAGSISKWFKIDSLGRAVDSLVIQDQLMQTFDSYLYNIDAGYYLTWLSTGDTIRQPFVSIGEGAVLNEAATRELLEGATYATDRYTSDPADVNKSLRTVVVFKERQWYTVKTTYRDFLPSYADPQVFISPETIDFGLIDQQQAVVLNYFDKEYWYGNSFWNISFAVNGQKPEHWTGTAYCEMTLNKLKVSFKKDQLDLYRHGTLGWYDLTTYQLPSSNYALVSMEEGRKQYVIRWN